jgi:hypothetical protein
MKRKLTIYFALISTGLFLAVGAQAQMAQSRFESEYGRTSEIIGRAQTLVNEAKTRLQAESGVNLEPVRLAIGKAEVLLTAALELQVRARAFGQGHMYLEGIKATVQARERAWQAVAAIRQAGERFVRQGEENENLVLRQLEKTDDLQNRVREEMPEEPGRALAALFDTARDNQLRAWEFYRNQNYRPALRLSRQAERTLLNILERLQGRAGERNRLENQFRQTEQRLEQAEQIARQCQNQAMTPLALRAREQFAEARQSHLAGDTEKAEGYLKAVQQMIRQIVQTCGDAENLKPMIQNVRREAEHISNEIRNSGNNAAIRLFESAMRHLAEAERHCDSGDSEACAANLKAAQMNLQKARQMIGI